jgi:hypothetical protein
MMVLLARIYAPVMEWEQIMTTYSLAGWQQGQCSLYTTTGTLEEMKRLLIQEFTKWVPFEDIRFGEVEDRVDVYLAFVGETYDPAQLHFVIEPLNGVGT